MVTGHFITIDLIDERRKDILGQGVVRWYACKLHEVADDKRHLHLVRQNAIFQSLIIPHVDRAFSADGKAQMTPTKHIHKWREGFAEIYGAHAGASFGGQHVIDDASEQYAFTTARRCQCQYKR